MYKYEILNTLVVHPKSKNKKTQTDKIKEGGKEWDGVRKEPYNNVTYKYNPQDGKI
jgi:hypothetical protein